VVNDLTDLMRQNVAAPPPDHLDLDALVGAGRRRIRKRRASVGGFVSVMVAGAVAAAAIGWPGSSGKAQPAERPTPDAPTIRLADAEQAVPGRDYRVVTSYTNTNLDRDNGQYFDGVTDDGLVLFRDGPRMDQLYPRFALLDPGSGEKDWLPDLKIGQTQTLPVFLGTDRLILLTVAGAFEGRLVAHVFDRGTRQWTTMKWPGLPEDVDQYGAVMGPDGRLYVRVPASRGQVPEGGWPTGPDGEAEDADADGDSYELWSLSTTDGSDVRDEQITVGDFAFTGSSLVWTDSTDGDAGMIHVRDVETGEEHSFDPHAGERCNLLSFGATEDRIVLGQYCGTYAEGGRDDRMQILTTDGDQVVTIQDDGIDGGIAGNGPNEVVTVTSYGGDRGGTYVYDLGTDSFVRLTDGVSKFGVGGGPVPEGYFMWHTPVNKRHGAKLWLGEILS
jgi:hypothetical protein